MNASEIKTGYVVTEDGSWYVQRPANNQWGFEICDDEQSWAGGLMAGMPTFRLVPESEVPAEVKESLGWILEQ